MKPTVSRAPSDPSSPLSHRRTRRRAASGALVVMAVAAGAGFAVYHQRRSFVRSLEQVGGWTLLASFAAGLLGVGLTYQVWRRVLAGLGVRLPWREGARVFFTTQLGKYLPGSVWPVVMQMELGRSRGASRRSMLGANVIMTAMGCCIGLIMACVLLPAYDAHALARYWWGLLALPFLVALLHPRALPAILDRALSVLHRPPLGERLDVGCEARAAGWSVASWAALGTQVWILCAGLGHGGLAAFLVSTGGVALAVPIGLLFIPAPAGAGIRDVVLGLALSAVLAGGQALAVVVASRAVSVLCDLALAGLAGVAAGRNPSRGWRGRQPANSD